MMETVISFKKVNDFILGTLLSFICAFFEYTFSDIKLCHIDIDYDPFDSLFFIYSLF